MSANPIRIPLCHMVWSILFPTFCISRFFFWTGYNCFLRLRCKAMWEALFCRLFPSLETCSRNLVASFKRFFKDYLSLVHWLSQIYWTAIVKSLEADSYCCEVRRQIDKSICMKQDSVAFQNPASFTRSKFTTKVTRNAKFFEYLSDAPERCNRKSRFLWSYNLTPGLQTGHFHLFLFFFYRNYCLWTKALCPTSLRHKTAG